MNVREGIHWKTNAPITVAWKEEEATFDSVNLFTASNPSNLPCISPGFVDIQINGVAGVNFGNPAISTKDVLHVADILAADGVTHFLPTLITDSVERMEASVARLAEAAASDELGGAILGIHLEGPYLSREDGPHRHTSCRILQGSRLVGIHSFAKSGSRKDSHNHTRSRASRGAIDFIKQATASGVRIALGHTAASRDQILAAVDAGATLSTHLGNAAHDQIQRHHNYIFDQLGEDRLMASLIVDGHHLPISSISSFE